MKITDFKDKHKGEVCYVIGNGPSLTTDDLDLISEGVTFGSNRIYLSGFEPTYYAAVNPLVIEQFSAEINKLNCTKFIPYPYVLPGGSVQIETFQRFPGFYSPEGEMWEGHTVTYILLQLAYYMGFETVYLLGVDHDYGDSGPPNQERVREGEDKHHFHPDYFPAGSKWHTPDLEKSELAYTLAKQAYEADGRKIINASRRTKLDVFPVGDFIHVTKRRTTALVSAYYAEDFLWDCLNDIQNQTEPVDITIVCQQGSKEAEIFDKWKRTAWDGHKSSIFVNYTDDIPPLWDAINTAILCSFTPYLTFWATDDRRHPKACELMADVLDARPEIDLVYPDTFVCWDNPQTWEDFRRETANTNLTPGRIPKKPGYYARPPHSMEILKKECHMGPIPTWRTNLHQRYGPFDPEFKSAGDYEFYLRWATDNNIYHIPEILGVYCAREDGIELRDLVTSADEAWLAKKRHIKDDRLEAVPDKPKPKENDPWTYSIAFP